MKQISLYVFLCIFILTSFSCKKNDSKEKEAEITEYVTTLYAEDIEESAITFVGEINESVGGNNILEIGFYYGTLSNVLNKRVVADNLGTEFYGQAENLLPGMLYYYKAFALFEDSNLGLQTSNLVQEVRTKSGFLNSNVIRLDSVEADRIKLTILPNNVNDKAEVSSCTVHYGKDQLKPDTSIGVDIDAFQFDEEVPVEINNLHSAQKYFFFLRIYMENGTSYQTYTIGVETLAENIE